MTVIPLRKPVDFADTHVVLSLESKRAWDSLKALVNRADRTFCGPSATATKAAELDDLLTEIQIEAKRVWRMVK